MEVVLHLIPDRVGLSSFPQDLLLSGANGSSRKFLVFISYVGVVHLWSNQIIELA